MAEIDTPDAQIARLNASLAKHGEDITLQRVTGGVTVAAAVTCRAFVRGYQPSELVGGITQQMSKVILSPTEIIDASWTSGRPANEDQRIPMKGNKVLIAGTKARNVEAAVGIYVAGQLVRIEMMVKG